MKIYITRHGETDFNKAHRVCGVSDILLNDRGIEQAKELAAMVESRKEELNISHIYVSDLRRAQQTASFTEEVLGIKAIKDSRIREMNFGNMEGVDWDTPEFVEKKHCAYATFEGGESTLKVAHRGYSFLEEIIEKYRDANENVLIVCHGTMAKVLSTYFRSYDKDEYDLLRLPNCCFLEYEV